MRIALGLALAAVLAAPAQAVVGGGPATQPYPHMAAMHLDGTFRCGGSLVAPATVLTAAHCVVDETGEPFPAQRFSFVLGRHRLSAAGGETILAAEVIVHDDYWTKRSSDVALIRLARPSAQLPIRIADPARDRALWAAGAPLRVIGWGVAGPYGFTGGTTDDLNEVDVPARADDECDFLSQTGKMDRATEMCAGEMTGGKDACQGDSGGPLMAAGATVLVGVVSHGSGCGTPTQYGYYARVGDVALHGWIAGRMAPPRVAPSGGVPSPPAPAARPKPAARKKSCRRLKTRKARKRCRRRAAARRGGGS